jgi:hypothetical protein
MQTHTYRSGWNMHKVEQALFNLPNYSSFGDFQGHEVSAMEGSIIIQDY